MNALYHKVKTVGDAVARCKFANSQWRKKILGYVRPRLLKMKQADRILLESVLGLHAYGGPIRASDMAARRRFGRVCAEVVDAYSVSLPTLRWFHITLLSDDAQTLERKPGLALKHLKAKGYKELQKLDLNALLWIDVDPMPNHPQGGEGGTFLFHVHAVAFTDKDFDVAAARQELKGSRAWSCKLGAPATQIVEITPCMGTPGWWAQYDAKPPYRAKSRIELPDGAVSLRWTKKGYRAHVAMRLTEGLAQMALFDTFFAVGEGKDLREEVRKRLAKWHRKRWPHDRRTDLSNVCEMFQRLWQLTRVASYAPWSIVGASV